MRVTTKGRYALRAVIYLAQAKDATPISIKQIAEMEAISPEFLEQLFFKLKNSGLISSIRGPGGGFILNRPAAEIRLKDIFDAVGERMDFTPCASCSEDAEVDCQRQVDCLAHNVWASVAAILRDFFANTTLLDVVEGRVNEKNPLEAIISR